jgi:hypothetical protein
VKQRDRFRLTCTLSDAVVFNVNKTWSPTMTICCDLADVWLDVLKNVE